MTLAGLETDGMENRLRVLRAERAWSQADLGERLDVSRQAVNAIETGKHDPSLLLAFKIATLFDQPIEAVFHPNPADLAKAFTETR
jgi:putative transcriptional regulator